MLPNTHPYEAVAYSLDKLPKQQRCLVARIALGRYFTQYVHGRDYDFIGSSHCFGPELVISKGTCEHESELRIEFYYQSVSYMGGHVETYLEAKITVQPYFFTFNNSNHRGFCIYDTQWCSICREDMYVSLPPEYANYQCKIHQDYLWSVTKIYGQLALVELFLHPAMIQKGYGGFNLEEFKKLPMSPNELIRTINELPDRYSRVIFQCIWTFKRDETILQVLPKDIFMKISEMIWCPVSRKNEYVESMLRVC